VTLLGSVLGNVAFVRENLEAMILLIIAASLMPAAFEFIRHRRQARDTAYDEEHERAAVVERVNRED
jgi:membrane-associated protein